MLQSAHGTIVGRNHLAVGKVLIGKNNQDATAIFRRRALRPDATSRTDWFVGVICDGCGSGDHSELGAQLGARLMARSFLEQIIHDYRPSHPRFMEFTRLEIQSQLHAMAMAVGGNLKQFVEDALLFSTIGVIYMDGYYWVFSLGDGILVANGQIVAPKYENNAPPYLMYSITGSSLPPEALQFQIIAEGHLAEGQGLMIGSDGLLDVVKSEGKKLPGSDDTVINVESFIHNDDFYNNADAVTRYLRRMNGEATRVVDGRLQREFGLLPDDTTLLMIRNAGGV